MSLKDKLAEAIERKNNDLNSFIWKGRKVEVDGKFIQSEVRLVDCDEEQLNKFYQHCESMLNNKSDKDPGRRVLLQIIKDQRERCNTELFLRWIQETTKMARFKFLESLRACLDTNKEINPKDLTMGEIMRDCPSDFADLSADIVLEGCLDRLGKFDKKHLTLTFILKQGLWFTPQEMKDFTEKDANGNMRDRIEVFKERVQLPAPIRIRINPQGLNAAQLRALIKLKSEKYSSLTTEQLTLLRDKTLFILAEDAKNHAKQWEKREEEILKVAEFKGYTINTGE